jgi:hypothetical protein
MFVVAEEAVISLNRLDCLRGDLPLVRLLHLQSISLRASTGVSQG